MLREKIYPFIYTKNTIFQDDDKENFNQLLDIAEYMSDCVRFGEFEFEFSLVYYGDDFENNCDGIMWLIEPENKERV